MVRRHNDKVGSVVVTIGRLRRRGGSTLMATGAVRFGDARVGASWFAGREQTNNGDDKEDRTAGGPALASLHHVRATKTKAALLCCQSLSTTRTKYKSTARAARVRH
jgi:hypothetical protein